MKGLIDNSLINGGMNKWMNELFLPDNKLICDCAWHGRMLGHPPLTFGHRCMQECHLPGFKASYFTGPTVWPNGSYSEKMPRHSGLYWVVVWTLPFTSIPRSKCSTWKLGQNGLICPFLKSSWLYHGIRSNFFFCMTIFFSDTDAKGYLITHGYLPG